MDGGAGRSDMAVVEARKFLSAKIGGMSKLADPMCACLRFRDRVRQEKTFGFSEGGKLKAEYYSIGRY